MSETYNFCSLVCSQHVLQTTVDSTLRELIFKRVVSMLNLRFLYELNAREFCPYFICRLSTGAGILIFEDGEDVDLAVV